MCALAANAKSKALAGGCAQIPQSKSQPEDRCCRPPLADDAGGKVEQITGRQSKLDVIDPTGTFTTQRRETHSASGGTRTCLSRQARGHPAQRVQRYLKEKRGWESHMFMGESCTVLWKTAAQLPAGARIGEHMGSGIGASGFTAAGDEAGAPGGQVFSPVLDLGARSSMGRNRRDLRRGSYLCREWPWPRLPECKVTP